MTEPTALGDLSVSRLLDALAAPAPAPCGGPAAALGAAMAAALVELVARGSPDWPDGPGVAVQAAGLRARLLGLADADAAAFARVLDVLREPAGTPERGSRLGAALGVAADVPLSIADTAADVASLAAQAESHGRPDIRADATVARELAAAATRAAAALVETNLATVPTDDRRRRARDAVAAVEGG